MVFGFLSVLSAGVLAQRIRRLALENNVPIVEKKPLAQALYRDVDINHPVPAEQYAAVAEVLVLLRSPEPLSAPAADDHRPRSRRRRHGSAGYYCDLRHGP